MNTTATGLPEEAAPIFYVGEHETQRTESVSDVLLNQAQDTGYDFVTVPVTTAAFHSQVSKVVSERLAKIRQLEETDDLDGDPLPFISPLDPADTNLTPQDSNTSRIAVTSSWIDLGSANPVIAHISRQVFNLEVGYAAFCGMNNIIVYGPIEGADQVQYARALREALALGPYIQLHVLLPMTCELEMEYPDLTHLSQLAPELEAIDEEDDLENLFGVWETWNTIRTLCSYSQKLSIALELPRQLPPQHLQTRWYSEPIRLLIYPRTTFLRNPKGYPVLSKPHQHLLSRFARLRFPPWLLLSDVGSISTSPLSISTPEPTPAEASNTSVLPKQKDTTLQHLQYLRHLQQTQPPRPPIERFGQGYQDYLQSPLQPLTDNLESITYEVFEKDPVKYDWYENAIAMALVDLNNEPEDGNGNPEALDTFVVAVVGAGRGPLVTRALRAASRTSVKVEVWAVEKNPNAFVLLQHRNATDPEWNGQVHAVKSDMRHWAGPTTFPPRTAVPHIDYNNAGKVDILVSELLGSFADNELSPECLDGVQHVLHPTHGICIPQSYSAHVTPLASPRIYGDLLNRGLGSGGDDKWEIPYVVMLHQYDYLCAATATSTNDSPDNAVETAPRVPDVKEAWLFNHSTPWLWRSLTSKSSLRAGGTQGAGGAVGGDGSNEHNARSCRLSFTRGEDDGPGECHGLAGYFETVLYAAREAEVSFQLSTNPVTMVAKSKDMISWFPIFFPLKTPLFVPAGAELVVYMWRQTDDRSVWYEWMVEVWETSVTETTTSTAEEGGDGMRKPRRKRRKMGMSEMGSSRKNACLM